MKIEEPGGFDLSQAAGVGPVQRTGPVFNLFQAYGSRPPQAADSATVSVQAQEIQAYTDAVKALPDLRPERVQSVMHKLQAGGAYPVAMEDLAEAMFRLAELDTDA